MDILYYFICQVDMQDGDMWKEMYIIYRAAVTVLLFHALQFMQSSVFLD